jgi:hypothetical protein
MGNGKVGGTKAEPRFDLSISGAHQSSTPYSRIIIISRDVIEH